MIIGQEMAEIRHGGGGAYGPIFGVCAVFLETARRQKKFQYLQVAILAAGSLG